jgi:ribose 5-phosphate isomerase B
MKILLASDHAGLRLKDEVLRHLEARAAQVEDFGTYDETSVDYPDFARMVAGGVSRGEADRGILVCGSGVGMSVAANKFPRVRAALVCNVEEAQQSRAHVDSNVLVLGQRFTPTDVALKALDVWLDTAFEGGRHQRRVDKIAAIEAEVCPEVSGTKGSKEAR